MELPRSESVRYLLLTYEHGRENRLVFYLGQWSLVRRTKIMAAPGNCYAIPLTAQHPLLFYIYIITFILNEKKIAL